MCSISFQVGTFKRPDPDTISDRDLEVDIIKAWMDLDKSLIAEGLIQGLSLSVRVLYAYFCFEYWFNAKHRLLKRNICGKPILQNRSPLNSGPVDGSALQGRESSAKNRS